MSRGPIVIRPAEPTLQEGLIFASYLDQAAEGFMRFLLGRRAPQILAEAYTRPDHDDSFRNVVFAEAGGSIVGMGCSYTAEQQKDFSDRPLTQAAGFPALRWRVLTFLLAPMLRALKRVPDGSSYLLALAVEEGMRGRGVGSSLMDFLEQQARQGGSRRLCLDVAAKNERARRLYERRGMSVAGRWPKLRLLSPLFVRMTKSL